MAGFSTIASGTGLFSYQWSKGGVDVGGATNATYTLASVSGADAGTYCVVVTGTCNSITNCASLTLNTPTTASGPGNLSLCPGQSAAFSTTASGNGPFTYQWRKANVDISGATDPTYSIASVSATDAGTYCVVVSGACNRLTNCATLTMNTSTTATGPSDLTVCQGANANFTTTANGTAPFNYAWTLDASATGTNGPSLTVPTGSLSVGTHSVTVLVTGECGSVTNTAALTINAVTTATGPTGATVCQGIDAHFSTIASGSGPLDYQWLLDGAAVGTNGPALTVATASLTNGAYTVAVVVSGPCGSVINSATLTVNTPTSASGPTDLMLTTGDSASFTNSASGTGPPVRAALVLC